MHGSPTCWPIHSQKRASCSKSAVGFVALLLSSRHQDACVCIACFGLIITRLLLVVNRLAASSLSTSLLQVHCQQAWCKFIVNKLDASSLSTSLMQVVSTVCSKDCKYQVATSLIFTDLLQLDEVNRIDATCDNVKQPGKSTTCNKSVAFLAVEILTRTQLYDSPIVTLVGS